jgi:ABC-type lipoprotein release transport system permease subunit
MVDQRIDTVIKTETSHLQLHHKQYLKNPDKKFYIQDADAYRNRLLSTEGIKAASSRIILNSMIQSPQTGSGVKIMGINPKNEMKLTNMYSKLIEGKYFEGVKRNPILIGKKLAEKLKVKLRSKVVVTLQDMNGEMTGASFRVVGIYETNNSVYDEISVFVRKADLARIIAMDVNNAHEIAVMINSNDSLNIVTSNLIAKYKDLDVKSWRGLMPEVDMVESSLDYSMYIFMVIILLALLFGIVNTMLMAVLERVKELGMLMAIGMNKKKVFSMIMIETVMLSLTGGLIGIGVSWLLVVYFGYAGVDISAWATAYKSLGYDTLIYTKFSMEATLDVAIMVVLTGMLASVYPAIKALKLKPAEAIRIDM